MARIKLKLPETFIFETSLYVRITDINYGGHLGNDALLSLLHDVRLQFFQSFGCSELDLFGTSVIMADVAVVYRAECFQGETLLFKATADEFGPFGFDVFYRVTKLKDNQEILVAEAKTGIVCFDYTARKKAEVPVAFLAAVNARKG
ncbi:MAG: thioesterase family protein [Chitinophagales bacterium]|nr:thioesterase family protein [Chitinophagales bacterium]